MESSESRIWEAVGARATPSLLGGTLYRIVESQEQIATRELVEGDLGEQAVLEDLIETSKPPRPPGTDRLDYLLATPWRYPPLRHGSRFGSRREPSLFYGGYSETTTLAEAAYYRFVFLTDMETPLTRYDSRHTLFSARYRTERGLRLQAAPFDEWRDALVHPSEYGPTQALGRAIREAGVEAFEFPSARDPGSGNNVALVVPGTLLSSRHREPSGWLCTTTVDLVTFSRRLPPSMVRRFPITDFLIGGELPRPA